MSRTKDISVRGVITVRFIRWARVHRPQLYFRVGQWRVFGISTYRVAVVTGKWAGR